MDAMAFRQRFLILILAAALALGSVGDAFARAGHGFSFGSRGARTFIIPNSTPTAPRGAAPFDRSAASNDAILGGPPRTGFFSGGGMLLGGLLGAGLFGLLLGHGLGGVSSFLVLLLQLGLLFLVFKWIMGFIRRERPGFQTAGLYGGPGQSFGQASSNSGGAFLTFGGRKAGSGRETKLAPTQADFSIFEHRLGEVQRAFGSEDLKQLGDLATPEMVSYFAEELTANNHKGVVNRISDVKLLQGDLAEAWREQNAEYATVAMRFSLIDSLVDRITGSIVSPNPSTPQQVTEVWTYKRALGGAPGDWKLSAIQQT
jgi:predicted lipid-binding transport protein (Tim44 family)